MPHVFISYKREEVAEARKVRQALRAEGFKVWWDEDLQAGEEWAAATDQALMAAGAVVVLWSPESVQSAWVKHEASMARAKGTLVPATIAPCTLSIFFAAFQATNLAGWSGSEKDPCFLELSKAVAGKIRDRNRSRIRCVAILLACLVLGAIGGAAAMTIARSPRSIPIILGQPREIGDFQSKEDKCRSQDDGAITLSVDRREPGDFSGCCVDVVGPVPLDILPGDAAEVRFSLDKSDRVVFKFENGIFRDPGREEAWIVQERRLSNESSQVSGPVTLAGSTPILERVRNVNRFCMALVGPRGPAPNRLQVRDVSIKRR